MKTLQTVSFSAAAAVAIASLLFASDANARRGGTSVIEQHYITKGPVKGYSGFVRAGARSYYCDYQRIPNRVCTYTSDGRERCKIESWTLKQACY